MSEKLDGLEPFHPERMASRILGMGDVLSLIEKAQQDVDEDKAKDLEKNAYFIVYIRRFLRTIRPS